MIKPNRTIGYRLSVKSIPVLVKRKGKLNKTIYVEQAPVYY